MFTNLMHRPALPDSARAGAAVVAVFAAVSVVAGHSLAIAVLVAAVLVVVWAESPHARPTALAAIAIGTASIIFGLVDWLVGLTADEADVLPAYGGVLGADKVVGVLLGVAQVMFLGLAVFFAAAVLASLPWRQRLTQERRVGAEPVADATTVAGEGPSPTVDEGRGEASDGNDSSGWWRPSSS